MCLGLEIVFISNMCVLILPESELVIPGVLRDSAQIWSRLQLLCPPLTSVTIVAGI